MRIGFTTVAPLPLLLTFVAVAAAQTPTTPPPIKMGLWQSEVTTSVAGAPNTPMGQAMGGAGRTTVTQGCLTPESWARDIQGAQQRQHAADCTQSNFQQDTHKVTFDEVCSNQGGYSTNVHFEMLIDDTEDAHGHADVKTSGPAFPQGMTMHMTMKTKFLSSDCGSVKPGEGKVIHE
ncbi:MAG: DUF3617 domain-containing protein [Acidobacteriota bacterium]